jgi:hypothetical protein
MQNSTLKELVSWLIIASSLWWTSGCYTSNDIMKSDEPRRPEILVETKSGHTISLFQGYLDSLGGISGLTDSKDTLRVPSDSIQRAFIGEAVVLTIDGRSHRFEDLKLDGHGRLSGNVVGKRSSQRYGEPQIPAGKHFTVLTLESVSSVSVETLNGKLSVAVVVWTSAMIVGAVYLLTRDVKWFDWGNPSWYGR